jgi:YwiC-like protein
MLMAPPALRVSTRGEAYEPQLTVPQRERRRALIVPREHGAWGMLLVPLVTGAAVGMLYGGRAVPVLPLTVLVLTLFWLRTPVESWLGVGAIRVQTTQERQTVGATVLALASIATVALSTLFWHGKNHELIGMGIIGAGAFAAQIFLKRLGRATRMAAEVAGALALTSTAAAAYFVSTGRLDVRAWVLWLFNWMFAADQVHFVWLRIRGVRAPGFRQKVRLGWSFMGGNLFLGGVLALAYRFRWSPKFAALAFLPVLLRGLLWFVTKPQPIVVRRLGWTELAQALVFATLLIGAFGFAR